MAQLSTIIRFLDSLLEPRLFKDSSLNGLQVDAGDANITKVGIAVDAGLSVIERAVADGVGLLVVHHGLLWGECVPISGPLGAKIRTLMLGKCSLYASHLPLDAHREVGNNFELARFYGATQIEHYQEYKGQLLGAVGRMAQPRTVDYFVQRSREMVGAKEPLLLPFGRPKIEKVAFLSGSGAFALPEAAAIGADLFVSGEPKQEVYHLAKELKINALFAGHYATETFGVRAVGRLITQDFDVPSVFIDEPTGI